MVTRRLLFLMIWCLGLVDRPAAQDFLWVQHGGGAGGSAAHAIQADAQGNTYVTGTFSGILNLCGITRTSYGGHDIFVAKFDPNGKPLWVEQAGGLLSESGDELILDAQGNAYVTGTINGTARFGSNQLQGDKIDAFVAKYSPQGQLLWVNLGKGTGLDYASALALDQAGTLYLGGFSESGISFDGLLLPGKTGFLATFNQNGQVQYLQSLGDADPRSLAFDKNQQLYLAGGYSGPGSLIKAPAPAKGGRDVFLTKWDPLRRQVVWTKTAGGIQDEHVRTIALDAAGNCYLAGLAGGPLQVGTLQMGFFGGMSDIFLAKVAPDGQVLWWKNAGGPDEDTALDLSYSPTGQVWITGLFTGQAAFSPSVVLTSQGKGDVYAARYDENGNLGKVFQVKGAEKEKSMGVATDAAGSVWLSGTFGETCQFGPLTLTPPNNYTQFFVTKIGLGNPLADVCTARPAPTPGPNPDPGPLPNPTGSYRVSIPNIITPNADGKNDLFAIGIDTDLPKQINLSIYNRWGKKILDEKNYRNTWAGSSLPATVYYYTLEVVVGQASPVVYKGWVELVR